MSLYARCLLNSLQVFDCHIKRDFIEHSIEEDGEAIMMLQMPHFAKN